jgi:hypothetical protein
MKRKSLLQAVATAWHVVSDATAAELRRLRSEETEEGGGGKVSLLPLLLPRMLLLLL